MNYKTITHKVSYAQNHLNEKNPPVQSEHGCNSIGHFHAIYYFETIHSE